MRCIFSSIAWKREQAEEAAIFLRNANAAGVEASPGLFDLPLSELNAEMIRNVRSFWEARGLPLMAMQALLFGKPSLRLFGSQMERAAMADYLRLVFRIAGRLGAGPLVFGSPKNRLRGTMGEEAAFESAASFFYKVAPYAADEGCVLCIEPNASDYGCDFIINHGEAARLVQSVNSSGFGLQVDTGVMRMNEEDPVQLGSLLREMSLLPTHVHISEPYLAPVNASTVFHKTWNAELKRMNYAGVVSVEMRAPVDFPNCAIAALSTVSRTYGD